MKVTMAAFAIILLVLACGDDNPAGSTPHNDDQYFPLAVGNQWIYGRTGNTTEGGVVTMTLSGSSTVEITGTETHSGGFEVFTQEQNNTDTLITPGGVIIVNNTFTDYLRVDADGMYGYPHLTDTDSSFVIPLPIIDGAVWTFSEEPPMTGNILSTSTNVTVSAGAFSNCVEIQLTWIQGSNTMSNITDFARNVGRLRNVYVQSEGDAVTTITDDLESYSVN